MIFIALQIDRLNTQVWTYVLFLIMPTDWNQPHLTPTSTSPSSDTRPCNLSRHQLLQVPAVPCPTPKSGVDDADWQTVASLPGKPAPGLPFHAGLDSERRVEQTHRPSWLEMAHPHTMPLKCYW